MEQNEPEKHLTRIELRTEGEIVNEYEFNAGRVIVGRSSDNEIYIRSKFVSRHHAQLIIDDTGCTIEDLNSTNGIFIEDQRVKKHRLLDGEIVSLGMHELIYTDLRPMASGDEAEEISSDSSVSEFRRRPG